jgi:hypothetical protein
MYKLTTTEDLRTAPPEFVKECVARAKQLSSMWDQWKMQDKGGYQYTVDVSGASGRAAGVHASEVSNCLRKLVYGCQGIERRGDNKQLHMQKRFNLGHAVHAMVQEELRRMCEWLNQGQTPESGAACITFEDEVRIGPDLQELAAEWNMHSSCDGVFTYWYGGVPYLRVGVEIKTESALEFEKLKKPRDYHMEQVTLYQAALDIPLMWLLHYNKSNSNTTESSPPWLFKYNRDLWERILEPRIAKAHHMASINNIPPRTEGFYCNWCAFGWLCQPPSVNKPTYRGPSAATVVPRALRARR